MAELLQVNDPRHPSEREAQERLRDILPREWIVTTNVAEKNFRGRRKPELDSVIISPSGIFILDFKNLNGRNKVIPMFNERWAGLEDRRNLFDQAQDNTFDFKNGVLGAFTKILSEEWVDWLIVLTEQGVDWESSDVPSDHEYRSQVCFPIEVEQRILEIRRGKPQISPDRARLIVSALHPRGAPLPEAFWKQWPEVKARTQQSTSAGQSRPSPDGSNTDADAWQNEYRQREAALQTDRERLGAQQAARLREAEDRLSRSMFGAGVSALISGTIGFGAGYYVIAPVLVDRI